MKKTERFYQVTGVVALRKAELFNRICYQINQKTPESDYKNEIKKILAEIISNMDNKLFIGKNEKIKRKIDPNLGLDDLNIDEKDIINKIYVEYKEYTKELK